jgi:putative tricarboxylic transport membrane protein
MADRIFCGVLLLVTLAYGLIAFTAVSAPFQHDPLGPESWPRILSVVAVGCILKVLWRPDTDGLGVARRTWFRLAAAAVLLEVPRRNSTSRWASSFRP